MSTGSEIRLSLQYDQTSRRPEVVNIANSIMNVLFTYFAPEWEGVLVEQNDEIFISEEGTDEFVNYSWAATSAILACMGFKLIGKDENGRNVVVLNPPESVQQFIINDDVAGDAALLMSDYVNEADGSSTFGRHDNLIIG